MAEDRIPGGRHRRRMEEHELPGALRQAMGAVVPDGAVKAAADYVRRASDPLEARWRAERAAAELAAGGGAELCAECKKDREEI